MNWVKNSSANYYEYHYHDSTQETSGNGHGYVGTGALGKVVMRGRALWKARTTARLNPPNIVAVYDVGRVKLQTR